MLPVLQKSLPRHNLSYINMYMRVRLDQNQDMDLAVGEIVSVRFGGVLRHYGIVTASGRIVSNSRRHSGVIEESLLSFSQGRTVKRHGICTRREPRMVASRARRAIGSAYDLTGSNCIDLARHSQKRVPSPWQTARALLMTLQDMRRR